MRRRFFVITFCLLFAGAAFGQSGQSNGNGQKSQSGNRGQSDSRNKNNNGNQDNNRNQNDTRNQDDERNQKGERNQYGDRGERRESRENFKFDNHTYNRINRYSSSGKGKDLVRVIVQHRATPGVNDDDNVKNYGGRVDRQFREFKMRVIELPADKVEKFAQYSNVQYVSLDERVHGLSGGPRAASGAFLAAQEYGVNGAGIGVAVIDSGIATHPDLQNVVKSVDFVEPTRSGGYDGFGHGTHVAGILAGSGIASWYFYRGIAPGAKLIDLRVLDDNGNGYTSDVIAAIEWSVANKNAIGKDGQSMNIRVLNLSLGHRPFESTATDPLTVAARYAVQNGIVVVAAAGNYGMDPAGATTFGGITSPGNEPAVITVGAMTTWGTDGREDDTVARYSSRGPTTVERLIKPDIVAPGSQVVAPLSPAASLAANHPALRVNSSYLRLSGTSMASPVVAGAVALMLQKNPSLTPNTVKAALMFTAEHRTDSPLAVGAGYVNVAGAVNLAANINTNVPAGMYWIVDSGLSLRYSNLIGGSPVTWGQTIVWEDSMYSGTDVLYNTVAWTGTMVWGSTIVWEMPETIVWEDAMSTSEVGGLTIVWEDVQGLTIVWEDAM
jgi:serine protease AprX